MKRIAFLFPGQGSQYAGMGKKLYENFVIARETFKEASEALGYDMQKLCFNGDLENLTKTENTQPAILTVSVAAFRVYMKEFGLSPALTAGHSLGEYTALTCAGSIAFCDCVKIVRERGRFMQEAVPAGAGTMLAVTGVLKEIVEEICTKMTDSENGVFISNDNSPLQTIISGYKLAVEKAGELLIEKGARIAPLKVSAPFHCPLMKTAADRLGKELEKYTFSLFKWPVVSNATALPYNNHSEVIHHLKLQTVQPVRWRETMEYFKDQGVEIAVEMGPKTVLKNLMEQNASTIKVYSYDLTEDINALSAEIFPSSVINKKPEHLKHSFVSKCIAIVVCTKNRNWDNEEYQKGVVEPYRKIQNIHAAIENEGRMPNHEEMKQALEMLFSVFKTKKVPLDEQHERLRELFESTGTGDLFSELKNTT